MAHKSHEDLEIELRNAGKKVVIGAIYSHYKNPDRYYKVIKFGIQEATDKICVIYQAQYGKKFTFVRDLESWLKEAEAGGKKTGRLTLIK